MANRLELRTRARIRADQDRSTFPSDTHYNYFLDEAAKEVFYDLVQAGWPINFTTSTLTITTTGAGFTGLVPGVANIAFIRGVYYVQGSTVTELRRLNEGNRASLLSAPSSSLPGYYSILIDPTSGVVVEILPRSSGSYRLEYITEFAGFIDDTTSWYGPARSDELIVIRAAIKGCRKEDNEQAARALEAEYERLLERVTSMASWLDMRNPATIRDVGLDGSTGMGRRDPFDFDV